MENLKWDNFIIAQVLKAYLIDNQSHRQIQREILGLPAPARGGGFETMIILHHFNIHGEKKNIFRNSIEIEDKDIDPIALNILKELLESEKDSIEYFDNNEINKDKRPTERDSIIKIRVFQDKLRKEILKNYSNKCALCEIDKSDLLVCSHIIPWSIDEENRLNPKNAICLCILHDRLFDKGYFTIREDFNILISIKSDGVIREMLSKSKFKKPKKDTPGISFLKYHAKEICEIFIQE